MRKRHAIATILLVAAGCQTTPAPAPETPRQAPPISVSKNRLTPIGSAPRGIQPPVIRVGMLSDQNETTFPRVEGGYALISDAGVWSIRRGFTVRAPLAGAELRWGVQVAALSDQTGAQALVGKILTESGVAADVIPDAATGFLRVIAGDLPTEDAAQTLRNDLIGRGYASDIKVVKRPSAKNFTQSIRIVDDEDSEQTFTGESLLVLPATAETIRIGGEPYRGGARLFVNPRGLLNVINEINLEDYVRGVVPNELGPSVYDEVEAQKAQALAARTYALKRLGEYRREGYDICPTPACQVYKGFATEQALSDQAVRESAGMIITWQGQPIDALYTSTCGGETSDVATMFPGRSEPYLRRARCVELDMRLLQGSADGPLVDETETNARLFARIANLQSRYDVWNIATVVASTETAARLAGLAVLPATPPRSLRRGELLAWTARALQLDESARNLIMPEDRQYLGGDSGAPISAAALLDKFRLSPAQPGDSFSLDGEMSRSELHALLFSFLKEMEAVRETTGKIAALDGNRITLKSSGKSTSFTLPAGIAVMRKFEQRAQEMASVPFLIGDRAVVLELRGKGPFAVVVQTNGDGASFDRTSNFANWTRSYRADSLVESIRKRNPIKTLLDLKPLHYDKSNRVIDLDVLAEGGRVIHLEGLAVRWSLGVPDNLFTFIKSTDPDGMDRYTFFGKGWGHGTGFCQVGAYGMAFRGWSAERIVKHFYGDVEVVRMK